MALTGEEENFVKVTKIVVDVIPKYLRKCFIAKWNDKYEKNYNKPWSSDKVIGTFLFRELSNTIQNNKKREKEIEKLKEGNEQTWDTTTVVFALVEAGLNLIPGSRPKGNRPGQPRISEEIEVIRDIRNSFFGHVPNMSCSNADFTDIVAKVKAVAKNIFGQDAEDEIDNVVKSQIKSKLSVALQNQLDVEINRNRDFNELVCEIEKMKEEFHKMEGKVRKMEMEQDKLENKVEDVVGNVESQIGKVKGEVGNLNIKFVHWTENLPCPKLPPYTDKDIDELKGRYKVQYQKHSINKVDKNGRIVMDAVNIYDFAVKLKVCETRPAAATFRDETIRYFENLEGMTGKDIDLNELLNDHDKRIILVNGIAAIGKSVLMKQLAFSWANNEIYTQFKLCIIMECREINSFVATEGAHLKKQDLFRQFLKTKFEYDLGGGVSTLFLLDGLDELWDIGTGDSMIWQLLDVKNTKYAMAKIILTGRPHVQCKLDRVDKDTGGIKRFEIQGLNEKQIKQYVKKIASCEKDIANIYRTIDSSEQCSQVASIPGFLNTLSCVAILTDGETLTNVAELYVWLLYLLLKEHVQKMGLSQKLCSEIFNDYSRDLEALCEVCHQLLNENKIIFEGDIKSRLLKCGKGAEFIEGLFADISDSRTKKYQFKHVTIMEFLSAIHISRRKNQMDIIEHNLKNGFYQVVIFSCQLIAGYKYDGIIRDMFGNDEELQAITVEHFLPKVLELVDKQEEEQQLEDLFKLSIDIIMCFINKDVSNKYFIISTVKSLRYEMLRLISGSMRKVSELCGHLCNAFKCNEEDLKETFENVLVGEVAVNDVKLLTCIKYLQSVEIISLVGMEINNSFRIRSEANAVAKCEEVRIQWCEFADEEIVDNNMAIKDHHLDELWIIACKLNKCSFINLCNWTLASVSTFHLWDMDNIEHSWWGELVDAIQNAKEKNNGILTLRELSINNCTQKMSKEMQKQIKECGVELKIINVPSLSKVPMYAQLFDQLFTPFWHAETSILVQKFEQIRSNLPWHAQPSSGSQGSSFVQQSQPQQSQQPPAPSITSSAQSHQQQTQQQSQSQPQQAPTRHQFQSGQAVASPSGAAIGGQPQGQVNNEAQHRAINYVTKIKNRFQGRPEVYQQFLDTLNYYQDKQKNIKENAMDSFGRPLSEQEVYTREGKLANEVYLRVAKLFQNQDDLLQEFSQFLPDASGSGHINVSQAIPMRDNSSSSYMPPSTNFSANISKHKEQSKKVPPAPLTPRMKSEPMDTDSKDGTEKITEKKHRSALKDVTLAEAVKHGSVSEFAFFNKRTDHSEDGTADASGPHMTFVYKDDVESDPQSYDERPQLSSTDDSVLNSPAFATNRPLSSNALPSMLTSSPSTSARPRKVPSSHSSSSSTGNRPRQAVPPSHSSSPSTGKRPPEAPPSYSSSSSTNTRPLPAKRSSR